MGIPGNNVTVDQLQFQTQLLERLHNLSPFQPQRSPYNTPSPYAMGPSLLLPPCSGPTANSAQLSPSSASLRVSQPNSFSSSPIMTHKPDSYGTDNLDAQQNAFIKPLPCTNDRNITHSSTDIKAKQEHVQDDIPPIILNPPPQGKRGDVTVKKASPKPSSMTPSAQDGKNSMQKSLATILRTPGPPPSRTTSARLPARNDLLSEVQRTTWARHTTK